MLRPGKLGLVSTPERNVSTHHCCCTCHRGDERSDPQPALSPPLPLPQVLLDERLTVTVSEAAALLSVSRAQAYQLARSGELPTVQLGGRKVVPKHRLLELLT